MRWFRFAAPQVFYPVIGRLLPWVMRDAGRKQRRYKRLIEAGRWPK